MLKAAVLLDARVHDALNLGAGGMAFVMHVFFCARKEIHLIRFDGSVGWVRQLIFGKLSCDRLPINADRLSLALPLLRTDDGSRLAI